MNIEDFQNKDSAQLQEMIISLNERNKELQCLHLISELNCVQDLPLNIFFQQVLTVIAQAYPDPEKTAVMIRINNDIYRTDNFKETKWVQSEDILVNGCIEGAVSVFYPDDFSIRDKRFFFREKNVLLSILAERFGKIIERKRVLAILQEREKWHRQILESITEYSYTLHVSNDGIRVSHHGGSLAVTGYSTDELDRNKNLCMSIIHSQDREDVTAIFRKLLPLNLPLTLEYRIIHKNKNVRWVCNRIFPRHDFSGKLISYEGIVTDITEQRGFFEALQETEKKFIQIADNTNEGFWIINSADGKILYYNSAFLKIMGFNADIIGENIHIIISRIHPQDLKNVKLSFMSRDNTSMEYRIIHPDGQIRWVRGRLFHVKNESDHTYRDIGIMTDITQYKLAAEKIHLREQQLIQADKMKSLGILISGIAHEINNPNNLIMFNSSLVADILKDLIPLMGRSLKNHEKLGLLSLPLDETLDELENLLKGIAVGSDRIRDIVSNLKDFAKADAGGMQQKVDINKVIKSAVMIIKNFIVSSTDNFILRLDENIPSFQGSSQQIEQVIINLITNSCHALLNKTKAIHIKTFFDEKLHQINVMVEDEGMGISEENQKLLFNPFFTTRRDKGGTGLGLFVSFRIVQAHKGKLVIKSIEGVGTKVFIKIPAEK